MQAPPLRLFPHSRTKVRLSEQNTKQKGKFFHFYLYFRAKVPSTNKSKVKNFQQYKKSEVFFSLKLIVSCSRACKPLMQADKPSTSTRDSSTHTHSHTGNVLFPYWETIIPTAGILTGFKSMFNNSIRTGY